MNPQATAPPKSAYRRLVLSAATSAQAAASFAVLGLAAPAGFLQQEFHLSAGKTGLLITANGDAPLFSLLFVGDLLDRKSERPIIVAGAAVAFLDKATAQCAVLVRARETVINENEANCLRKSAGGEK